MYKIFCIVPGDENPFAVDIDETQTVFDLQTAIETEQPDLATVVLGLYRIDVKSIEEVEKKSQDLSGLKRLEASEELSVVFGPTGPGTGDIHIILVQPSAGESIYSRSSGTVAETV